MYRVGLEAILGFTKVGDTLRIEPCAPAAWWEFSIDYRFGEALYEVTVRAPGEIRLRGAAVSLDGTVLEDGVVPLIDDGEQHEVRVGPRTSRDG